MMLPCVSEIPEVAIGKSDSWRTYWKGGKHGGLLVIVAIITPLQS